jgi:glycosyltransferase involved in cell wall biosynthesis
LSLRRRSPRIFLGLVEVAGYYAALERGFRGIGVAATAVDITDHPFRYNDPRKLPAVARLVAFARRRSGHAGRTRVAWRLVLVVAKLPLVAWALWRFDVFVFGCGTTFFRLHELPLLRLLGKRIVVVFHGSDARPPYMDGADMAASANRSIADCAVLAAQKRARIRRIEQQADVVICHPLYSHFLERPYVRSLSIGLPLLAIPSDVELDRRDEGPVRVLHSPSSEEVKGTIRIRDAINALIDEGLPIDFVEVRGKPHAEVRRELAVADLVVDQLYSDTSMAGFAAEAASFGRPAVVGSLGWDEIRRTVPQDDAGPVQACHPDDISTAIRQLVADRGARLELGDRARRFVVLRSDPSIVAARFLQVITDGAPAEWTSSPSDTRYLCGAGLPAERVQSIVRDLVREHGPGSLQLRDKPELESALIEWANSPVQ